MAVVGTRAVVALALLLAAPGCFWLTTKGEGSALRKDVTDLKGRVSKQEESVDTKVKQLDDSLEKATALLKRNSADVGAEVEALSKEMAALTGSIEGFRRDIEELRAQVAALTATNAQIRADYEQRLAAAEARVEALEKGAKVVTPTAPDKDTLYANATTKLQAGQLTDARKDFRDYVKKYPQDAKADDAQYWVAESFYREKQYEKAIAEFQKVIDAYPDADMADDAFLQAGTAAADMKWCVDANAYFGELVRRYPKSTLVKTAKQKLEHLKKNAKNKDVCQG